MRVSAEKIERAERQLDRLKTQRQQLRQRLNAQAADRSRRDDTRRKILVGAAMLKMDEQGQCSKGWLMAIMDHYLTRDDDRELFGLPPIVQD